MSNRFFKSIFTSIFLVLITLNVFAKTHIDQFSSKKPTCDSALSQLLDIGRSAYSAVHSPKAAWQFVKDNKLGLSPMVVLPAAALTLDGNFSSAIWTGAQIAFAIKSFDPFLDLFMDNADHVIPRKYLVSATALATNLPEGGASQASALIAADGIHISPVTPIGSNWANVFLLNVALASVVKNNAVKQGIIKPSEKMKMNSFFKSIRHMDWKGMKKDNIMAANFMTSALIFQNFVRPQLAKGNYLPLASWVTGNIPLLLYQFGEGAYKRSKKLPKFVASMNLEEMKSLKKSVDKIKGFKQTKILNDLDENLIGVAKASADINKIKDRKIRLKKLNMTFKEIKKEIQKDPRFRNVIKEMLEDGKLEDLQKMFEYAGIELDQKELMRGKNMKEPILAIAAGAVAIVALSVLVDSAVSDIPEAIPGMDKSDAGFFLLSIFSSLPEFMATRKFLSSGDFKGGAQQISDSNAINIILAQLAMTSSAIRSLFGDAPLPKSEVSEE